MKQVIQSFRTGELTVTEVPSPILRPRGILVRTVASLVSAGTERMVVDFAEKNLLQKARARPDLVKQVVDKAGREGILSTFDSVRNRLDQPLPLGYSSAGVVVAVGTEAEGFHIGDRVACAGGGYASHAELVYVPRTLAVTLPNNVPFEAGAFATLGAIALQGIRQAEVTLGHKVAVIGLGLLGQLTVQMLKAAGCDVFGIDINPQRVALARELGAAHACVNASAATEGAVFSAGRGFDAVLITADTKSDEPVTLAGEIARDRAPVVAVGAVGLSIPRKQYYEKELDLRLSRSYGPGRYDAEYEEKGLDYPYAYVRWTEGRNMEAVVRLLATEALRVEPLITHRFPIDDATQAYDVITGKTAGPFLGIVLGYDIDRHLPDQIVLAQPSPRQHPSNGHATIRPYQLEDAVRIGLLGAGNFVNATLLPAMRKVPGIELVGAVSGSGLSARGVGDKFGFAYCAATPQMVLDDERVNWLVIATRHDLHARQAIDGLLAGKNVFVEKPLALNRSELVEVIRAYDRSEQCLIVGFNRRFAPMIQQLRHFVADHRRPLVATYRVNAGSIPADHWTQDPAVGGGRLIGEACHFIDLLQFLIGAPPTDVYTTAIQTGRGAVSDEAIISLTFADGSVGTVIYAAGGDKAFGKERLEVFGDDKVAVLDDYRSLELVANGKRTRQHERLRPDKGHQGEWAAITMATRSGTRSPISLLDIVTSHLATFAAMESLRERRVVRVETDAFWSETRREQGNDAPS